MMSPLLVFLIWKAKITIIQHKYPDSGENNLLIHIARNQFSLHHKGKLITFATK